MCALCVQEIFVRETGFNDVCLATTKHEKIAKLGVILEEFDHFQIHAQK